MSEPSKLLTIGCRQACSRVSSTEKGGLFMTSVQFTTARSSSTRAARVAEPMKGMWHAYLDWRARHATLRILRSLDSRTLHDIGLNADEIESAVYGKRGDRKRWYDVNWHRRSGK